MIDIVALQRSLDLWPDAEAAQTMQAVSPRLASALQQAAAGECGAGDLAGLMRDVLRHWQEAVHARHLPAPVRVPSRLPWPTQGEWAASGIHTAPGADTEHLRIVRVEPWRPDWSTEPEPLDAFPAGRSRRRWEERVAADPVWRAATGFDFYKSLEQREAVRTLLLSAEDDTVLVLLPTGSGKSAVGLLHALVTGPGAVSAVVVPTTSLALDQEEQFRERLRAVGAPDADTPFAFHGGLLPQAHTDFLARIRVGGQRAVFASPESLFGALGEVLAETAVAGRLGQFVVDEAHIVSTWGADFRPDFQAIAGFRSKLREVAAEHGHAFRTVLMTATAARADISTLSDLFTEPGRPLVAGGAVALRPEIAYATTEAPNADIRLERVEEALRQLPRPLFVYATTREDVGLLEHRIRGMGIHRVVKVTGDSNDVERRHAVRALRGTKGGLPLADVAIGTSAFGLGIDINDVRCVVHACLPEGIDRYYQEVGRSGRDGRASLGLLMWTRADTHVAARLGAPRLITVPLARQHWYGMLRGAEKDENTVWVDSHALRIGLFEESSENKKWNSRTLSSMARAGLVRLVGFRRTDEGRTMIGVELLRHDLSTDEPWHEFESMRTNSRRASKASLQAVLEIAQGSGVCAILEDLYTVHAPDRLTADLVAHHACGGCPACAPPRPVPTPPLPIDPPAAGAGSHYPSGLAQLGPLMVAAQSNGSDWARAYGRLIKAAAAIGIRHVVCTPSVLEDRQVSRALREVVASRGLKAPLTTLIDDDLADALDRLGQQPTLLLLSPHDRRSDAFSILDRLPRPTVAVLPASHPARERQDMTIKQMHPGAMSAQDLELELAKCLT